MAVGERQVGNLPAGKTRMVGRRTELAEIGLLFAGAARLVTLTGVGGVGKTRLALEAAAGLQSRFRDGAWLVELSPLRRGGLLPHLIAEALPLADQTARPVIDVLADYLADRELLLVLDTCEHLTDACALTVQALARAAPGLRILATSRRTLNVPGEEVLTVEPLPIPETDDPAAAQADAVVLLGERAAEHVPGFKATDAGRAELIALGRRLEGLPLAIELAAARLGELPAKELTERLDDRFAVLGETDELVCGADPPWHQALRTAIGWSHQLCSPAERLLWARLSVFAGTFDAEAARQMCADAHLAAERITDLLAALVDKSILTWQPTGGGERYRMLDTLREYGADWLRRLGEEDELRRRHRDHYRALAHRADAGWMGPDQIAWYDRTVAEHANLRTALDFCLAEEDGHSALDMGGALWFFWLACGYLGEGRHYLDRALQRCPASGPVRSKGVWTGGVIAMGQGDSDAVARMAQEFRAGAEAAADPASLIAVAHLEGTHLLLCGEPAQVATVFDAVPYTQEHGGAYTGARFLAWMVRTYVHTSLGEFTEAAAAAAALRAECVKRGERWIRAFADYVQGLAELGLGRLDEAATHTRTALKGKAVLHDSIGIAMALDLLASVAAATGQGERAARLLGIGQRIWDTIGRSQAGLPDRLAAREACERQARKTAGDSGYEAAFRKGVEDSIDDGLAYALHQT